jgi:ribosomal protein L21E
LSVPSQAWQAISLDFIEGLPQSGSYNTILVKVDRLTKYAHFVPLRHPFTALKVAQVFMAAVYRLHGMPESIVSDRDRIFTSTLWKELFQLSGTQLQMSSAYHPQMDGQTERVNQCLETYLRIFVQACPSKWNSWLSVAEYWYNCCFHSSLGKSPFEVLYGRQPRHFGLTIDDSVSHSDLSAWLLQRELMMRVVQHNLLRAQQRMKNQADKSRSEREFQVGDMVYLKLQPYIQSSVAVRANHKLSYKYFGPYEVLQRVGAVAYKLKLPDYSHVQPVFHVSQLKPSVKQHTLVSASLSSVPHALRVTVQVLQRRVVSRGGASIDQVLIRWSGFDAAMDSWEDECDVRHRFPCAVAWGQASTQDRGNVSRQHVSQHVEKDQQPDRVPMEDGQDAEMDQDDAEAGIVRLGRRVRRPNTRYPSSRWTR